MDLATPTGHPGGRSAAQARARGKELQNVVVNEIMVFGQRKHGKLYGDSKA